MIKNIILSLIAVLGVSIFLVLLLQLKNNKIDKRKFWHSAWITFITDFLDNIGIGCFAPQTYLINKFNIASLKQTPGSLNVGYIGAAIAEAFLSLTIINVDMFTLVTNVLVAMIGSFVGSKIVHMINEKALKNVIGYGLLIAAITILLKLLNVLPESGMLIKLQGIKLVISLIASFFIGMGITFGIGNFAPTIAVFLILGFDPKAVFPIMIFCI